MPSLRHPVKYEYQKMHQSQICIVINDKSQGGRQLVNFYCAVASSRYRPACAMYSSASTHAPCAWASTPLEHWLGGGIAGRAPKTRESRRRGHRGGWVSGRAVPLLRKFMNFSSQNGVIWCILGVLFLRFMCPMDCSCMINLIEVPACD